MTDIIKHDRIVADDWDILRLADGQTPETVALPQRRALLPLAVWLARKHEIRAGAVPFGVWLDSHEEPERLAADVGTLALIGVNFPKFTDGRGYSIARLLRERHGFRGELRAIGEVLRDQLFLLRRCGFDAFALREGKDAAAALDGLLDFSERYQGAADEPLPLFRRRAA